MENLIIYGKAVEGKPKIYDSYKIHDYVSKLPEGTQFELIIRPVLDSRSLKLNRTYWMYLTMVGDELGYSKNEMHDYFKMKFLCEHIEINGEITLSCKSTSDLSTKKFCEYLESIFFFCSSELGIVLPDIEDIRKLKRT